MQKVEVKCGGEELAKVLRYYGLLTEYVTESKIICPFHEDINPSMIVNLEEGRFFCFGCYLSGNALDFVKHVRDDLNELEVCLEYIRILQSDKVSKLHIASRTKPKKEKPQAFDEAHDYYYGLNKTNWCSKELDEDVLAVREYMLTRGFKKGTLKHCGAKYNYNHSYPIIFPMLDNGDFKGWVCRTDKAHVEARRKYLYNEGFSRTDTLVGTYGSKDYVIVVEGYMDRLKMLQNLHELGIKEDVVAILGWKMSVEQENKLKAKGVTKVISALDNDKCGRKGTKHLQGRFEVVRFTYLKGYKDPGDMEVKNFRKMYERTLYNMTQDRRKR